MGFCMFAVKSQELFNEMEHFLPRHLLPTGFSLSAEMKKDQIL